MSSLALAQAPQIPTDPTTGKTLWFCETRGGMYMCIPRFPEVLGWFQGLQRAINAYAAAKNKPELRVWVDGRIGPQTLGAYKAIAKELGLNAEITADQLAFDVRAATEAIAQGAGVGADETPNITQAVQQQQPSTPALPDDLTPSKKSRKWLWVTLAVLAVAGIGIASYVWWRRSRGGRQLRDADDDDFDGIDEVEELPALTGRVIDV